MNRSAWLASLLLVVGLLQMFGQVVGAPGITAVGLVTAASPAPKVFSTVNGLETFSTRFRIEFETGEGERRIEFDADQYAKLEGPYNRRNPYGALLAYGPILSADPKTKPMFAAASRYALCGDRPLLAELGVDPASVKGSIWVQLTPRPGSPSRFETRFEVDCQ